MSKDNQHPKKKKPILLFIDEKYFTVDPICNSRTNRYISSMKVSDVPDSIKFVSQTKHPAQVMMFGLVSSDGKKCHQFIFPQASGWGQRSIFTF